MLIPLLLVALSPAPPAPQARFAAPELQIQSLGQDLEQEYKDRRAEADGDADKLWKLVDWCDANGLTKNYRSTLRAILKLDDGDEKAHELLGHVHYEGEWFTSEKKLAAHKKKEEARRRAEEERKAKEEGLVLYKDVWVMPEEIPFLDRGMVKDEYGEWVDPQELELLAKGWVRQDLEWVAPEDQAKIDQGLWKCGEEWLTAEAADEYHSELGQWWRIPGSHYVLYTTTPRQVAEEALRHMEATYADLVKVFGTYPGLKPRAVVLRSIDQYSLFANGSEALSLGPTEAQGLSSVHGAYFAETWFDFESQTYHGSGVAYWDIEDPNGASFGRLFARHAAAQSFVEGLDPSPNAIAKTFEAGEFPLDAFWEEKMLPRWLRYGAASYAERYYVDSFVGPEGNPYWAREWSVSNLQRQGGLSDFDAIFEFNVTLDDPETSTKLINEAGLLISFVLDGDCAPVKKQHQAVKAALKKARLDPSAKSKLRKEIEKLEKLIAKHGDELTAYAGL